MKIILALVLIVVVVFGAIPVASGPDDLPHCIQAPCFEEPPPCSRKHPCATPTPGPRGWQGAIDWAKLASQGVLWAAIRASVGN